MKVGVIIAPGHRGMALALIAAQLAQGRTAARRGATAGSNSTEDDGADAPAGDKE